MALGLNSGEAKMADLKALLRNLDSLKKRAKGKSNPILDKRMRELLKKIEIAKAGPGDAIRKRSAHDLMLKRKKKNTPSIGSVTTMKDEDEDEDKVEADDWWGEDEDPDWWKAKPKAATTKAAFGRSPGALGGRLDLPQGFKHGGRIKKPKKKTKKRKRAALRGYRAELRGG